jgi:hypothetical protein
MDVAIHHSLAEEFADAYVNQSMLHTNAPVPVQVCGSIHCS